MWYARAKNKYRNEKIQTENGTFDSRLKHKFFKFAIIAKGG